MKYIIIESPEGEHAIIFGSELLHSQMSNPIKNAVNILSAGHVTFSQADSGKIEARTYGESTTLKLKPRPDDKHILESAINNPTY